MNHLEFHFEVNTLESKIKKNLLNRLYSNVKGSKKSFLQQTIVCLNLIYVIVLLRFSLSSLILNLNRRQMQNFFQDSLHYTNDDMRFQKTFVPVKESTSAKYYAV